MSALRLALLACLSCLSLLACALDDEARLRAQVADWLFLDDTFHFTSRSTCTVAVFRLSSAEVKMSVGRAGDVAGALRLIRAGRPVLFDWPDTSPNAVSEQVMSHALEDGLGLVSSVTGPARDCMGDASVERAFGRVVMSARARTLYDAAHNLLVVIWPPENLAFVLRGNV